MKIIILDDHEIFAESLSKLINESESVESCDYVTNPNSLFKQLNINDYDICLLDINIKSDETGFEILEKVLKERTQQNVVILSSYDYPIYREKAFNLGAKDYINKSVGIEELLLRLKNVQNKNIIHESGHIKDTLTNREIEVLKEIISGNRNSEIAKKLFISERTLYNHINSIYNKLNAKNKIDAYNKAIKIGYIDPIM